MTNKLYVGNLSFSMSEEELANEFAQFGTVNDAHIVFDRMTNRSKGFAFVEMEDADAAQAAIEGLNGREIKGRALRVSEAQPRAPRA